MIKMYKISENTRKYSPTPIVKIENGKETIVLIAAGKKKDGDNLLEKIVIFLNENKR